MSWSHSICVIERGWDSRQSTSRCRMVGANVDHQWFSSIPRFVRSKRCWSLKIDFSRVEFFGFGSHSRRPAWSSTRDGARRGLSRLEASNPLVPLGFGFDRPWRVKRSWDQFPLPRPGSRARVILGPRIHVPDNLSRDQLESIRLSTQRSLNCLTDAAEQWAADNRPRINSELAAPLPAWKG